MSELKKCPFCGGEAQVNTWTMHGITESRCFCSNSDCPNSVRTVALEQWNNRPIEDELKARIAELEAAQRWHVVKECNDVATPIDAALRKRIAELEGKIDQLTAHSDIERQDDKSSNDTQTSTIVYGKEREE